MLLVVDVGNTNTVLGVYDGDTLRAHWRHGLLCAALARSVPPGRLPVDIHATLLRCHDAVSADPSPSVFTTSRIDRSESVRTDAAALSASAEVMCGFRSSFRAGLQ